MLNMKEMTFEDNPYHNPPKEVKWVTKEQLMEYFPDKHEKFADDNEEMLFAKNPYIPNIPTIEEMNNDSEVN